MDSKAIQEIANALLMIYDCPNTLDKHRKEYESRYGKEDYDRIEVEFGRLWFHKAFPDPDERDPQDIQLKAVCSKRETTKSKAVLRKSALKKQTVAALKPQTEPPLPKSAPRPTIFDQIDELQNREEKIGPMTEAVVQNLYMQIEKNKGKRIVTFRCCNCTYKSLFDFRKHLFECHRQDYDRHFTKKLSQNFPTIVRGVDVSVSKNTKKKKSSARNEDSYLNPCKGDHFHIIYTPMGNKR